MNISRAAIAAFTVAIVILPGVVCALPLVENLVSSATCSTSCPPAAAKAR